MIHNIKEIKGREVFWYDDFTGWKMVIGIRGLGEFKIDRWDMMRAEDSFRIRNGRAWNDEEAIAWAIKYAQKESEYIDFEEIKIEPLRLNA